MWLLDRLGCCVHGRGLDFELVMIVLVEKRVFLSGLLLLSLFLLWVLLSSLSIVD